MASFPTEFSLESVRQYMLMRDGQVTNHELVKHFKHWLTHPTEKDISRQKFKEYVNTLATIKQVNGEKYLVLKQKFYPKFDDDEEPAAPLPPAQPEPSLLDEVMASYTPISSTPPRQAQPPPPVRRQLPPLPDEVDNSQRSVALPSRQHSRSSYTAMGPAPYSTRSPPQPPPPLPPYRAPPPAAGYRPSPTPSADFGLPLPSEYGLPTPRHGVFHPPPAYGGSTDYGQPPALPQMRSPPQEAYPPPLPAGLPPSRRESMSSSISRSSSVMSIQGGVAQHQPRSSGYHSQQRSSRSSTTSSNNVSRKNSNEDKENASSSTESVDFGEQPRPIKSRSRDEKISVKERTKTFNRMASEVDLAGLKPHNSNVSNAAVKRRNSRATSESKKTNDDESQDSSSISTLDQTVKQWMVKSSQGDYHAMVKMLRDDPKLAKHRDFVSGYTALHWAAKHGNVDLVKLLAGNYGVPVNVKSHGGYTPLHMACQFGHQEVFDILVKAYGADPQTRDNAGKKPRQYMVVQDQAIGLSNDTFRQLKDRRNHRRQVKAHSISGAAGGMLRFGSLSVKVKKTTEAFNSYFNSKSESESQPSSLGPISLPMDLVHTAGMGPSSLTDPDAKLMPPPKLPSGSAVGLKKKRSKKYGEYGRHQSAPVTPTGRSSIKEESHEDLKRSVDRSDSDSEYGFDSQWAPR